MGKIDLNADAGESFGNWRLANEEALFPQLSSVNLACGFHAADPLTMHSSVALARKHGLAVGAHPGFMDKAGFGRRDIAASFEEIMTDTLYQLGALQAFLQLADMPMHHVKAHGALYLKMMQEEQAARAVCEAVANFNPQLPLVVLAGAGGKLMQTVAKEMGLRTVAEAFPDRAYLANGQLAPRKLEGSVLNQPELIAERAVAMASGKPIAALDGGELVIEAQTLCLHGDNANAPQAAAALRQALSQAGFTVQAF